MNSTRDYFALKLISYNMRIKKYYIRCLEQHYSCRFPQKIIEHLPNCLRKRPKSCPYKIRKCLLLNAQKRSSDMTIHICLLQNKCVFRNVPDRLNSPGLVSLCPENLSPPNAMSEPKNQGLWLPCAAVIALVI